MSVPPEQMGGQIIQFDQGEQDVEYTDDGGAILQTEELSQEKIFEFYDNIVDLVEDSELEILATNLLDSIDRDKKAREKRDKEYAESIKRTGLGKEAPGGAEFSGASRVVHPMLTEATVDFSSRAIKELMPPDGPVKSYIPGDRVSHERLEKADRKKDYMNWQFLSQMPEFRAELEQLLTQLALNGSQYIRLTPDWSKRKTRATPRYIPQDQIYIPYSASNFYSAERQTYAEQITKQEFEDRVKDGMYKEIDPLIKGQMPEPTEAEKATSKVEGKADSDHYNEDGVRIVFEVSVQTELDKDKVADGISPYLISIDEPTRKIVSIIRNWEHDDEYFERMQWIIEFQLIPWRGAYSIGLGQMIGSLSGAATGALRALLDSAHINNIPTGARLKGANFSGQSKEMSATEMVELDGGIAGDDIRKLLMTVPFNPPSPVLFQLLGFCVDAGRGVVQTSFEKLNDRNANMPVGTTLALIEEGMQVMSAIHLRLYHSMTYVIKVLHRINKMYITDEQVENDIGDVLAYRDDFQGPLDVVPTADPQVFSDVQRLAQLQIVSERAAAMPDLYNVRAVEKRLLDRTKIPNPDELLVPEEKPEAMNAVNENVAMALGRPVSVFPDQDHLAHMQVLMDFMQSDVLGKLMIIAPSFLPAALEHLKEHMTLWYITYNYEQMIEAMETDDQGMTEILADRDPETLKELDKLLAQMSPDIMEQTSKIFEKIPQIVSDAQELIGSMQKESMPEIPVDPNAQAETERKRADDVQKAQLATAESERKKQDSTQDAQIEVAKLSQKEKSEFAKLSAKERETAIKLARDEQKQAMEKVARFEQLEFEERAEDERTAASLESVERRNTQDNLTAMKIAAAEMESGEKVSVSTGTGINPSG